MNPQPQTIIHQKTLKLVLKFRGFPRIGAPAITPGGGRSDGVGATPITWQRELYISTILYIVQIYFKFRVSFLWALRTLSFLHSSILIQILYIVQDGRFVVSSCTEFYSPDVFTLTGGSLYAPFLFMADVFTLPFYFWRMSLRSLFLTDAFLLTSTNQSWGLEGRLEVEWNAERYTSSREFLVAKAAKNLRDDVFREAFHERRPSS